MVEISRGRASTDFIVKWQVAPDQRKNCLYATQLLHNYATHTQKLKNFFYTLEEQGPMKLMLFNLYDASMVPPVELDSYGSGN